MTRLMRHKAQVSSTCPMCGQRWVRGDWLVRLGPGRFIPWECWEKGCAD